MRIRNKNMIKKMIAVGLIIAQSTIFLTGCNVFKNKKTVESTQFISTCNSNKLYSGQYYIWHDESQSNIERDINTDMSKFKNYTYDIFQPVYKESDPANDEIENDLRILMLSDENDGKIPTLYKGDELIYYSDSSLPSKFTLERFYDHGYSFGFYGLTEYIKKSGQYVLWGSDSVLPIKSASTAKSLMNYLSSAEDYVSIPSVGDKKIESKDISKSGTIKGLIHGSQYDVTIYTGTNRHILKMTADTRIFSSYEEYKLDSNSYDFVGKGVIVIHLPEYLKDGYYFINGAGLFRYVNSASYDDNTNFNDPIVVKDDNGKTIYDPRNITDDTKITYNNTDKINDAGVSSSVKASINVQGNTVVVTAEISDVISKSIAQTPVISYYKVESAAANNTTAATPADDNAEGSKNNPYVIKATAEELAAGKLIREIPGLSNGVWMFTLSDIGNYNKHTLNVTPKQEKINSSKGDF